MIIRSEARVGYLQLFRYVLYLKNITNRFTNTESSLLALMMREHPTPISPDNRKELQEELAIKASWFSQNLSTLHEKGYVRKIGYNVHLDSDELIKLSNRVKNEKSLKIIQSFSIHESGNNKGSSEESRSTGTISEENDQLSRERSLSGNGLRREEQD